MTIPFTVPCYCIQRILSTHYYHIEQECRENTAPCPQVEGQYDMMIPAAWSGCSLQTMLTPVLPGWSCNYEGWTQKVSPPSAWRGHHQSHHPCARLWEHGADELLESNWLHCRQLILCRLTKQSTQCAKTWHLKKRATAAVSLHQWNVWVIS